jgi:hypothetical protein
MKFGVDVIPFWVSADSHLSTSYSCQYQRQGCSGLFRIVLSCVGIEAGPRSRSPSCQLGEKALETGKKILGSEQSLQ